MCQFCTRFTGTGIVFTAGFRTCFNPTPNINLTYGYMFVLNWMYSAQSFPIETASTHTNTHTHTHEARANQISMKPKRPFQGLCFFNPSGKQSILFWDVSLYCSVWQIQPYIYTLSCLGIQYTGFRESRSQTLLT